MKIYIFVLEKKYSRAIMSFEAKSNHAQIIESNFIEPLVKLGIDLKYFKIQKNIIQTRDFKFGDMCIMCLKKPKIPYYLNPFRNPIEYLCISCGDAKDETKQFIESYKFPYNLVIVNTENPEILKV